jgi:hypothetical protein
MEEAAFLTPVQGVIGGIEIENDLARRRPVSFEEQIDEQAFDRRAVVADLVIARGRARTCACSRSTARCVTTPPPLPRSTLRSAS